MLKSKEGDVEISPDFTFMKIAFTKSHNNITDHVIIDDEMLHKSIMNYDQLSLKVHQKLLNNECLNMMTYGTPVTCGNSYKKDAENRPRSARDAWPHQLQNYMMDFLPACQREGKPSQHRFIRVHCACGDLYHRSGPVTDNSSFFKSIPTICENSIGSDSWLDHILINRLDERSMSEVDLNNTDIVIVEAMYDFEPYHPPSHDIARYVAEETERFIQVIRRHHSDPSMIYLGASIQFGGILERLPSSIAQRSAAFQVDGVFDQLPVVKHYSLPYISVIDAYCPFANDEAKQSWADMFLCDAEVHPSRTGQKIVALLLLHYFKKVQLSSQSSSTNVDLNYTDVRNVVPLHFTPQQLKEYVEDVSHQPLTIVLNSEEHRRFPFKINMNDFPNTWSSDYELLGQTNMSIINHMKYRHGKYGIHSLWSYQVNGHPFVLWFRADVLNFHFQKRHIRVVLGKAHTNLGSVQIQVRFHETVVSETVIDCLLPVSKKEEEGSNSYNNTDSLPKEVEVGNNNNNTQVIFPEAEEDFAWHAVDIHIPSSLEIDPKLLMNIRFTVVESHPKRTHNMIKLMSVSLS